MTAVLHGVPVNLRLDVDALGGVGLQPSDIDLCGRVRPPVSFATSGAM